MTDARAERRLTAILAGDIVGYSRLVGADEEGTLARVNAIRREFWEPKIAEHRGRIVKRTGDGVLIEFASVVDAARYGVEIQRGMAERNAEIPQDKRIELRMGIHVGDVVIEEDDIFGDGVNVAARLEGIAEPGGICFSRSAFEQVDGKLDVSFEDGGDQQLKNIARPVRVYRTNFAPAPRSSRALELPDKPSIAVLPFQNMSDDPDQDYFADGIVEDIITGLSRIKWLFVIARNSSFTYKGRAVDVKQVGRELGVRYVLEGSVRKSKDRVRITGQLVEAESGRHLWAERYDRALGDIFALQDEITMSVVGAIEPSLRHAEVERVKRKRPENLDAYDLLLRAISTDVSMPAGVAQAVPFLERALVLEPDYARAHGHLAMCHHALYLRGGLREENLRAAIHHAHAAIAHGQDDSTALALAGFVLGMDEHDRAGASEAFEKALALSPSSAFTYGVGSAVLGWGGDAERAIEWAERALRLNPFDSWNFFPCHGLALGRFSLKHYAETMTAARKAIQFNPAFSMSYMLLAAALAKLGRLDEARAAAARVLAMQPSYRFGKHFVSVDCAPSLAASLSEALDVAGLPQ
jgi:TolB-like protein/Flp pilus assembly protein TadD